MKYKTFETERLILRPTLEEDGAFILALMNTPKWIQHIGDRKVRTLEAAKEYIRKKMMPQLEKLGYGNYTVVRKTDGLKIGSCGLYDREGLEGIDIGFAFLPAYEKQGYGLESSQRLKQAAFEEFGIVQISAITTLENVASQRLLERLGLKRLRMIRLPDDPEELLLYRIEKADDLQ